MAERLIIPQRASPSPRIITSTFRTAGIMLYLLKPIGINDGLKSIALTEREKLWVKDSLLRFYVVWTRKESLIKCEGRFLL